MGVYRFIAKAIAPISSRSIKNRRQKEFWDKIGGFDPLPYWQTIEVPAFVAYGENDEYDNVPVAESVRRLQSLNKRNITVKVYPGGGNAVEDSKTDRVQTQLLEDLVDFIEHSTAYRPLPTTRSRTGRFPSGERSATLQRNGGTADQKSKVEQKLRGHLDLSAAEP